MANQGDNGKERGTTTEGYRRLTIFMIPGKGAFPFSVGTVYYFFCFLPSTAPTSNEHQQNPERKGRIGIGKWIIRAINWVQLGIFLFFCFFSLFAPE